ncbi:chitodextrinase [Povalibacter uvarum]|uniref:Chitodextrinase n=1 Tax=Povalibacter uvarum TaxID=732238 RepID=A0A841HFU4_9GAMM|nr:fibronectin type III domain-containing protein [Povalibacter uvarum]MBB6091981.1 chitodextrinase [Povalibacter uvarum]
MISRSSWSGAPRTRASVVKAAWGVALLVAFMSAPGVFASNTTTYTYDALGRLTTVTGSAKGSVATYDYDAAGNRTQTTSKSESVAPSAPTGLSATVASASQVNLSWSASTDTGGSGIAGYRIYRNGSQVGTSPTTSYSDSPLTDATTYTYRVAAYDIAGNLSAQSSAATATTPDATAPTVPTGLAGSAPSSTQVNLSWTASTDNVAVAGYRIYRNGSLLVSTGQTSYTDSTVSGTVAYSYTVAAYDAVGNLSGQSAARNVTTPDSIAPSVPTGLSATPASQTQINLSWSPSTDTGGSGLSGYRIYRNGSLIGTSATNSYSNSSLTPATTYSYSVAAYDAAGNASAQSGTVSATTPDSTAPSVPTGLTGSAASASLVNLSWSASSDNVGVTGYRIYRGGSQIGTSATTSYADSTVVGSTTYSYTVAAHDAAGNVSGQSAVKNIATPDVTAPSTPTGLSAAAAGPSRINLSWSASSDTGGSGLAGYRIYRGGSLVTSTAATSYSDTGLAASTSYSYTVAAYDNAGNASGESNTASATTLPPVVASLSTSTWRWLKRGSNPTQIDAAVVCTGSGGTGSGYTYAWQWVSGDTETSAISPTSNNTRWSRTVPYINATYTSVWRCLVTDGGGNTGQSNVTVNFVMNTLQ